ncbi:MAG: prepilin-type N-terminal cleavage/methylation domain-containing protein, partial [Oscillospiraceae bacterium]|nr:prepilin-type N-terminal cleavage/methylation domain-containing protein [Oscillospiraceae bacterium]
MKTLRKNKNKGFTLVEIIVVLVIIAILMAALAPVVMGWITEARDTALMAEGRAALTAAQAISTDFAARGTAGGLAGTDPTAWTHTTASGQNFNSLLGSAGGTAAAPYTTGAIVITIANNQVTNMTYQRNATGRTATWAPVTGWTVTP